MSSCMYTIFIPAHGEHGGSGGGRREEDEKKTKKKHGGKERTKDINTVRGSQAREVQIQAIFFPACLV